MDEIFGGEIAGELVVSVLGGVLTAVILEVFRSRARGQTQSQTPPRRRDGFFSGLARLVLAVIGGVLIALFLGRYLFQAEILERSPPTRLALLVGGTILCWALLLLFRRR